MNGPPGLPILRWDPHKKHSFESIGQKYLILARADPNETMDNISPFLIKKAIDITTGTPIEDGRKLKDGTILLITKNTTQAEKLTTLTSLGNNINVTITPHKSLNTIKAVFFSRELRGIPEEEIAHELKSQKVIEIKKILKKHENNLIETGLIIATINSTSIPDSLYIGYQKVYLRPFLPNPLKCNNCFKFGHPAKYCTAQKICFICGKEAHLNESIK